MRCRKRGQRFIVARLYSESPASTRPDVPSWIWDLDQMVGNR